MHTPSSKGIFFFLDSKLLQTLGRTGKSPYLEGNYGPVDLEHEGVQPEVVGKLPQDLNGLFVRVGPNPYFKPLGDYHWFDGDGMLHACRIKDGKVVYSNKWVDTNRLRVEKKLGYPTYTKFGDSKGAGVLLVMLLEKIKKLFGVIPTKDGAGTSNTALAFHAGKLLALHEGDLPYQVRMLCTGVLETLGRVAFDGKVKGSFTAHPKLDPVTGELFFIGYDVANKPHCRYGVLDPKGNLKFQTDITIPQGVMMHDCAITEEYMILLDLPLVFDPEIMIKKNTLPFRFDASRTSNFGVLPRYSSNEEDVRWFHLPAMAIFHVANAWQEGPLVKLYACCFDQMDLAMESYENMEQLSKEEQEAKMQFMNELIFNMETGEATRRRVAPVSGDFPVINPAYVGRKNQHAFMATLTGTDKTPLFTGIAKIDLQETDEGKAVVGSIQHGEGRYGGEAYFVASRADTSNAAGDDDGYLITYVYDEKSQKSEMVVYNAKTMDSEPVARVKLPQRVPFGFHALHIDEDKFQKHLVTPL